MPESLDIHRLLEVTTLESVTFMELSAKRADEDASHDELFKEGSVDIEPEFTLQFARNDEDGKFRIRIKTHIDSEPGRILVDAAAEYEVEGIAVSDIESELMLEFANKVAIFAIIPYLRQGVADMTQRVFGVPLTMPMYRRGELEFSNNTSEAD
jgi:preprotein translocase subunit SecB